MNIDLWNDYELYFHHEFINAPNFPISKQEKLESHFGSNFIKGDYTIYQKKCNPSDEITEDDFFNNRASFIRILFNIPPTKVEELLQFHFDRHHRFLQ